MRKFILILLMIGGLFGQLAAQQDPMFTKYMFNSLAYNPGFAGSPEYLSVRALQRGQWLGIDGAPTTQSVTWRADWSLLRYRDPRELDSSFSSDTQNRWMPNFGAGIFYYTPN